MIECTSCQAGNPDEASFCQNCGQALGKICTNCSTENDTAANFCMNCGQRLVEFTGTQPPQTEAGAALPAESQAERRIVTVLFCDVVGSTSLGEQLDPETWTEIMNGFFERTISAVRRYDGTVDRMLGDAVMAVFGAPIAYEDDPYRAVLAAMRIIDELGPYKAKVRGDLAQEGVEFSATDFEVRIGINTGLVVVSHVGAGQTRKWTPLGDTVNLAARMEQTAQPGKIRITADTYKKVASFIEIKDLGQITVKGKQEPVHAYEVLGFKEKPERGIDVEELESPLVARELELARLQESLKRLRSGKGSILFLVGEAGLGKSRLLRELKADFLNRAEDISLGSRHLGWYESESLSFETSQPYGLVRKLLRQIANIKRDDGSEEIRLKIRWLLEVMPENRQQFQRVLEALFGLASEEGLLALEGEDLRNDLFEGLQVLFRALTIERPILLVLEDLHWADSSSVEIVKYLLPLVEEMAILILCVMRPDHHSPAWTLKQLAESQQPKNCQEIILEPLSAEDSDALVGGLLKIPGLPARLGSLIIGKTEGVPIFIEEIVWELIESGALTLSEDGRSWQLVKDFEEIAVPDTLESVLVARMDRLEESARRTLQLAAVIGRSFQYQVLRMIASGNGQLEVQLEALQQAGMIREAARIPDREFIFRHVLAQEAAYNTILLSERRMFHQQVGEVMEQLFSDGINEQAALLAHHFSKAGDHSRALDYYSLAAENAARLYANDEAVTHYTSAINITTQISVDRGMKIELHRGRGQAYESLGNFVEARSEHETALELASIDDDLRRRWQATLDLGNLWASRDYFIAGDYYNQAQELARTVGDPIMLATTLNRIGNWHNNAENPSEAQRYHLEALEIFEGLGDKKGLAATLDLLAVVNNFCGNVKQAAAYYDRAIALFRELEDRQGLASCLTTRAVLSIPGFCYFTVADLVNSLDMGLLYSEEAQTIANEIGRKSDISLSYWPMELIYLAQGRYDAAFEAMRRGLQIATDIDHSQWIAAHLLAQGMAYCDLLNPEQVELLSGTMLQLVRGIGSSYWINLTTGILTRSSILLDDLSQAEARLNLIGTKDLPMDTGSRRYWWTSKAELYLARGDAGTALKIVENVTASVEKMIPGGMHSAIWHLRGRALASTGRPAEAEATLLAGQDHAQRIGERSQLWRIQAELGQLYKEMGCDKEAEAASKAASELIEDLAKTILDEALKDRFVSRALERCA